MTTNRESSEHCGECGFEWDEIPASVMEGRINDVASQLRTVMLSNHANLATRPQPDVWSPVEYGAHIRDVMLNLRDRIIVGVAEENPTPKSMHVDLRAASGLYNQDSPEQLAVEIPIACDLMRRVIVAFASDLERPIFYPWPRPATRTLRWVAAQAVHEAEHHLADIKRQLSPGPMLQR